MQMFSKSSGGWPSLKFLAAFAVLIVTLVTSASGAVAFSTPATVLTGLVQPTEPAVTINGDLYFAQLVSADTVTLSKLASGSKTPVEVYRLVGSGPYLNDIHFDKAGNLIFITSIASADSSSRRWALVRLIPSTGIATELVVTTGVVDPSAGWVGAGVALLSGTEINFVGVDGLGTIDFTENFVDGGNQVSDLLALKVGTSTQHRIGHFANPIVALNVVKTGDAYISEDNNGGIYQYQAAKGTMRVLIPLSGNKYLHTGLDAAGNLYVLERTLVGPSGFGQATSTIVRIDRFSAAQLKRSNPTPVVISNASYDGFIALWAGSSSFFRVSSAGDVYWVQSLIDPSKAISTNQIIGVAKGKPIQSSLYEEFAGQYPTSSWDSDPASQGPIGLAINGGGVFASSTNTGDLLQIR